MSSRESAHWSDVEAQEVETGRFKRAWRLGKLGAKMTGSLIKDHMKNKVFKAEASETSALQSAALRNAQEMVEVMGQLKGAAMKLGQMLSADPELIDPQFAEALSVLQRQAPPMPYQQLKSAIEVELQSSLYDVFDYFDPKPLGAASIGQVHHAILKSGEEVAVKIQYPGIRDSLASDLSNIERFFLIGRTLLPKERAKEFIAELKEAFEQEADYEAEAAKLREFNEHFREWPKVRIPKPHLELCTPNLLIMEFIDGSPLTQVINDQLSKAERDQVMELFIKVFIYMFHDLHRLHADPHPGNFMLDNEGRLVLLDFGCVRSFQPQLADEVLELLPAFWSGDPQRQLDALLRLGFGKPNAPLPRLESIARHQTLVLAPMAESAPFSFFDWRVSDDLRALLTSDLNFMNLIPPAELLLYLRVISGIKGTLTQIDASCNIRALAEEACLRRGLLS